MQIKPLEPRTQIKRVFVSPETLVIARQRGISVLALARSLNVSHQRVHQLTTGTVTTRAKSPKKGRKVIKCPSCGRTYWKCLASKDKYCSPKCRGRDCRVLSIKDVIWAMEQQQRGWPWMRIGKSLRRPIQTIQSNIWIYLFEHRQLAEPTVKALWRCTGQGNTPAWNWLVRRSKMLPSTDGGSTTLIPRLRR